MFGGPSKYMYFAMWGVPHICSMASLVVGMGATQTKSMVNKMLWARVSTCLETPNYAKLAPILAKSKAKGPKWSPMGGGAGPIACNAN